MPRIKRYADLAYKFISSNKFFIIIVALLIIQASWFALTARYPMAFDENYHFEFIKFYSSQWSPFIDKMPSSLGVLGDITRVDSYLYHYLMSFPYRLINLFVNWETAQIIILRFINIGMFVASLYLFRKLFRRIKISEKLINFSTLMLALIPVAPFLAATINYDNLMMLLIPLVAIITLKCRDEIKDQNKLTFSSISLFILINLLGSIVKYAYLPIFAACLVYLLIIFITSSSKKNLLLSLKKSFISLRPIVKTALVISLIIVSGLFIERYGVNIVKYKSIEPDCAKIQSVELCQQNGPWGRDRRIALEVAQTNKTVDPSLVTFIAIWGHGMVKRLYFAINYNYSNFPPLLVPILLITSIGLFGIVLVISFFRKLIKRFRGLVLFAVITMTYVASLFINNYSDYLEFKEPLAINGRYLIIVMPMILVFIGLAYRSLIDKLPKAHIQRVLIVSSMLIVLLLSQGGGALTHLVRSQPDWYWQNKPIIDANINLKNTISPFIIGGRDY